MSFDPFRPDDAGDYSATFAPRHATGRRRSVIVGILVAVGALLVLGAVVLVAVAVA